MMPKYHYSWIICRLNHNNLIYNKYIPPNIKFDMKNSQILVTGGAGFIGSSLVKYLLEKEKHVTVFDNFSVINNLKEIKSNNLKIIKGDLTSSSDLKKISSKFDTVFHLAADPEVRLTKTNPKSIFQNNILSTYNLLEQLRQTDVKTIVFTSTSAVYGDATLIPTPESYPCTPISMYGASKLSCESLLSAYCNTYKKNGIAIRLANVVGPSSTHGIIFDMIKKLKDDPTKLEILGDGTQNKSYLYINDCISGIVYLSKKNKSHFDIYNMGSDTQIKVKEIIDLILDELGYSNVKKIFTGGVDGGRGWVGDVKKMLLDIGKIKSIGWKPVLNSHDALQETLRSIAILKK